MKNYFGNFTHEIIVFAHLLTDLPNIYKDLRKNYLLFHLFF